MPKKDKKIGVLIFTRFDDEYIVEDLKKYFFTELDNRKVDYKIFFANRFMFYFEKDGIQAYYEEKKLDLRAFDLFFVRTGSIDNNFLILKILEAAGVKLVNSAWSCEVALNKNRTYIELVKKNIPIIPTFINNTENYLGPVLKKFKDGRTILKMNRGSWGKGVALTESQISMVSIVELLASAKIPIYDVMLQKYIKRANGRDKRVYVVGNKVVAVMVRKAGGIDFRANIHGTGLGKKGKLSEQEREIAINAAKALKLDYAGVDLISTDKGPAVVEVNCNPGFKITDITGVNVAGHLIDYIMK